MRQVTKDADARETKMHDRWVRQHMTQEESCTEPPVEVSSLTRTAEEYQRILEGHAGLADLMTRLKSAGARQDSEDRRGWLEELQCCGREHFEDTLRKAMDSVRGTDAERVARGWCELEEKRSSSDLVVQVHVEGLQTPRCASYEIATAYLAAFI